MTPQERRKFESEIYLEIHRPEYNGCISDAADYLRHPDSSRVSRIINPNDSRTNNLFGELSDLLEAFHYKYPKLEEFIWQKLSLRRNAYKKIPHDKDFKLAELADKVAREQLDVNFAISRRATQEELEAEAFQAMESARIQYENIVGLRSKRAETISDSVQ